MRHCAEARKKFWTLSFLAPPRICAYCEIWLLRRGESAFSLAMEARFQSV
jgi:hypothetical protein